MAKVGDIVPVSSNAPETGRYRHTAPGCQNTIILNQGNKVPPCTMGNCSNKSAGWMLIQILT